MIKKILFPVDFSPSCTAMAAYVKRAAAIFGSQVTLLYVCDLESHNGFELYVRSLQEIAEEHWGVARCRLDSFLESEFPVVECPRLLRSGEAAAQISEVARTGGFDLIIMPTHAGRFRRMLLGSTTAKVLDDADCPVLTTEHAEIICPRPLAHRQWVCGVSSGADSERVLRFANGAAAEAGATLLVVHAIDNGVLEAGPSGHPEHPDSTERKEALLRMAALQQRVGCEAAVRVVAGPVKQALIDAARESEADILIIGRTPRSGALGRMRDLTYSLIRDSPVPVSSV
jgi:nucleotide-binding universal stress UspA family protein